MTAPDHAAVRLRPVGVVHSPYETVDEVPHQGFVDESEAVLEVFEPYAPALAGLSDVLRLTVVYWADRADRETLEGDDGAGAFARRGPDRPNPLNICTCTVLDMTGRRVVVRGMDAVDGSPLVDLKPALQAER